MENKIGFFGYIKSLFTIYGITVILLNIFCVVFGGEAQNMSTIFSLGNKGISVATMMEFFLANTVIMFFRFLFMTDKIIKNMPLTARIISLFVSVLCIIVGAIFVFGWFPVGEPLAWIMFSVCFVVCCAVSTVISAVAEKKENEKLEQALKKYKEEKK